MHPFGWLAGRGAVFKLNEEIMNLYSDMRNSRDVVPVDVSYFYECIKVATDAAKVPIRTKKPKKAGLYLTDIPINRSMLALAEKCRNDQKSAMVMQSVMMRFMHIPDLFSDLRCKEFVRKCDEDHSEMHHALIDAAAQARFISRDEYLGYDVSDVIRLAKEYVKDYEEESV